MPIFSNNECVSPSLPLSLCLPLPLSFMLAIYVKLIKKMCRQPESRGRVREWEVRDRRGEQNKSVYKLFIVSVERNAKGKGTIGGVAGGGGRLKQRLCGTGGWQRGHLNFDLAVDCLWNKAWKTNCHMGCNSLTRFHYLCLSLSLYLSSTL